MHLENGEKLALSMMSKPWLDGQIDPIAPQYWGSFIVSSPWLADLCVTNRRIPHRGDTRAAAGTVARFVMNAPSDFIQSLSIISKEIDRFSDDYMHSVSPQVNSVCNTVRSADCCFVMMLVYVLDSSFYYKSKHFWKLQTAKNHVNKDVHFFFHFNNVFFCNIAFSQMHI